MKKILVSPAATPGKGYSNDYFVFLKKELSAHYEIIDPDNKGCRSQSLALLAGAFRADVALLSFVETIAFHRFPRIQTNLALAALQIMYRRGIKVVFFFHNPKPHKGENCNSRRLTDKLFQISDLVVCHSENTAEIARERVGSDRVLLVHHPMVSRPVPSSPGDFSRDVLIWGDIFPYKGVAEFVEDPSIAASDLQIDIVGRCKDPALAQRIERCCSEHVRFRNERPSQEEVATLVLGSRYVLFPYLPGSISGSGALMDTLSVGGTAVGPDAGAFHDLSLEGVCLTYRDRTELVSLLLSNRRIDRDRIARFIRENSWSAFVDRIQSALKDSSCK